MRVNSGLGYLAVGVRGYLAVGAGLILCSAGLLLPTGSSATGSAVDGESHGTRAQPSGYDAELDPCATGCSAVPELEGTLTAAQFDELVAAFAKQAMSSDSLALETLLFHGADTLALLDSREVLLDPRHETFLRGELARTHALLDVRVIDEKGALRLHLGETLVPLGEKQHIHAHETVALQSPEISGTVQRVGLKHLWARF